MTASRALQCPDCNADINADLRACAQCGAELGRWPESQRSPLILPGNPALSADVVRKRVSLPKVVGGVVLGTAFVGAVLYFMPEEQTDDRDQVVATSASRMASDALDEPRTREVGSGAASTPPALVAADSLAAYAYGDTVLRRAVPAAPRRAAPATLTRPPSVASASRASRTGASRAAVTPPRTANERALPTSTRSRASIPVNAELRMLPLVSNTLRPGERLQLRWSVADRRSRRAVVARVEFTSTDASVVSVDPTRGVVIARAPGSASIIVDGGAAGQSTVRLTVRAPASSQVVTVAPAPSIEPPRVAAIPSTVPLAAPSPVSVAPSAPAREMPDAGDVRAVVDRFIRDVRSGSIRNFDLTQFFADGAGHRVSLVGAPNTTGTTAYSSRIAFEMHLSKYDGGGRPVTRVASVTMDVEKRASQVASSAITIGALQRP